MLLRKHINSLIPTGTKQDVPKVFHEPHVETGFRLVHQPWSYYLWSLFQRHNECMNSWTHLLGLVIVWGKFYQFPLAYDLSNPYIYPFLAAAISMTLMYICSVGAHCFHNMSEQLHYTCFFIDYVGIGTYGLGSAIAHHYYCADSTFTGTLMHDYHMFVAVSLSLVLTYCCCYSKMIYKRPYPFARKIWQVSSVCAVYVWLVLPIHHRIYVSMAAGLWESSFDHHITQTFWFLAAGFFFGSDIPQRFFPGKFDFVGHSHQIFHVCIMLMSIKQIDAIYIDMIVRGEEIREIMSEPTLLGSVGAVLISIAINLLVVAFFHFVAKQRLEEESQQLHLKSE